MEEVESMETPGVSSVNRTHLGEAWYDLTGLPLDAGEVERARALEMKYATEKKVWTKIRRIDAVKKGYRIIKTRWIDINKGDDQARNYRSRFVAKEFNGREVDGLFAATPPLEPPENAGERSGYPRAQQRQ